MREEEERNRTGEKEIRVASSPSFPADLCYRAWGGGGAGGWQGWWLLVREDAAYVEVKLCVCQRHFHASVSVCVCVCLCMSVCVADSERECDERERAILLLITELMTHYALVDMQHGRLMHEHTHTHTHACLSIMKISN